MLTRSAAPATRELALILPSTAMTGRGTAISATALAKEKLGVMELITNVAISSDRSRRNLHRGAVAVCALVAGSIVWIALAVFMKPFAISPVSGDLIPGHAERLIISFPAFLCVAIYSYLHITKRMACRSCRVMFSNRKCGEKTNCRFHEWRVVGIKSRMLKLYETRESWQTYRCDSCGHQVVRRHTRVKAVGVSMPIANDCDPLQALWTQRMTGQ